MAGEKNSALDLDLQAGDSTNFTGYQGVKEHIYSIYIYYIYI
jgi:hypothetical protein